MLCTDTLYTRIGCIQFFYTYSHYMRAGMDSLDVYQVCIVQSFTSCLPEQLFIGYFS